MEAAYRFKLFPHHGSVLMDAEILEQKDEIISLGQAALKVSEDRREQERAWDERLKSFEIHTLSMQSQITFLRDEIISLNAG